MEALVAAAGQVRLRASLERFLPRAFYYLSSNYEVIIVTWRQRLRFSLPSMKERASRAGAFQSRRWPWLSGSRLSVSQTLNVQCRLFGIDPELRVSGYSGDDYRTDATESVIVTIARAMGLRAPRFQGLGGDQGSNVNEMGEGSRGPN